MTQTQIETAEAFTLKLKRYDEAEANPMKPLLALWEAKVKLENMDRSLTRLYGAGCLSLKDFKRLDQMIFNRMMKLEA